MAASNDSSRILEVCNMLDSKKSEVVRNLLVKVDTVPELLNGLIKSNILPSDDWATIAESIMTDETGVMFATRTYEWIVSYLRTNYSCNKKRSLCASLFFNYVTLAHGQHKLKKIYDSLGVDINSLVAM